MTDLDKLARGLTEAQRRWIMDMPTIPVSMSPADWDAMPQLYVTLIEPDPVDGYGGKLAFFACAQADKPIGTEWYLSAWLNDTGLALKQHIERSERGN